MERRGNLRGRRGGIGHFANNNPYRRPNNRQNNFGSFDPNKTFQNNPNFRSSSNNYQLENDSAYSDWAPGTEQNRHFQGPRTEQNKHFRVPRTEQNRNFQDPRTEQDRNFQGPRTVQNRNFQGPRTEQNRNFQGSRTESNRNVQGPSTEQNRNFRDINGHSVHTSYLESSNQMVPENEYIMVDEPSLKERSAITLLNAVQSQNGISSLLVFLEVDGSPLQTLQGAVDYLKGQMIIELEKNTGNFVLKINQKEYARGTFPNKQTARLELATQTLNELKKTCFYILKKKVYEEVDNLQDKRKVESGPTASFEGSKAHQMMLKMGWGGKGLGVNEQGQEKTVAETLNENVTRQGLGNSDIYKQISNVLENFGKSNKLSILRFAPDFTSDERAHIHKIAAKYGLKSKSEGKGEQRRLTISKKLNRMDLVHQLLVGGCENSIYKLFIPSQFQHLVPENMF